MWVELDHGSKVLQWVLLEGVVLGASDLRGIDNTLHLIAVDQTGDVSVCHAGARQLEALLGLTLNGLGAWAHNTTTASTNE